MRRDEGGRQWEAVEEVGGGGRRWEAVEAADATGLHTPTQRRG